MHGRLHDAVIAGASTSNSHRTEHEGQSDNTSSGRVGAGALASVARQVFGRFMFTIMIKLRACGRLQL